MLVLINFTIIIRLISIAKKKGGFIISREKSDLHHTSVFKLRIAGKTKTYLSSFTHIWQTKVTSASHVILQVTPQHLTIRLPFWLYSSPPPNLQRLTHNTMYFSSSRSGAKQLNARSDITIPHHGANVVSDFSAFRFNAPPTSIQSKVLDTRGIVQHSHLGGKRRDSDYSTKKRKKKLHRYGYQRSEAHS